MSIKWVKGFWQNTMLNDDTKKWLRQIFGPNVRFDEPLARHTSFKIGGPADALIDPESKEQLKMIIQWAREKIIPFRIIGGGTNLLVRDGGIRGMVIRLGRIAAPITWEAKATHLFVKVGAGAATRRLCRMALQQGWQGMNFALGIPGTVGGAILMNAGTVYGSMADVLEAVTVMNSSGEEIQLQRDSFNVQYRKLDLPKTLMASSTGNNVLLTGLFRFQKGDRRMIHNEARMIIQQRTRRQPGWQSSAGCFFKNPDSGKTAGQLIDEAGMKGVRIGDAMISRRHANFIVNMGHASAAQVLELAAMVQERVEKNTGVRLTHEVHIAGEEENNSKKSI